ncbi:spatacsin [Pseudophryne corroboree]|uniref:spatacsin n=1 Tax=Pseudophryne corroboree TaxID=495146 RepID=UPI003081D1E2
MELSILLDPGITLQDWAEQPVSVSLIRQKNVTLCSLLPQGSLLLTTYTSGTLQGAHTHLNGPFTQFLLEDANPPWNPRLLTLSQNKEFCVHEVCAANGQVKLTTLCLFDEKSLRQLCIDNHVCAPSLPSVRLLSMQGDDILILLSSSVLVHLSCTSKEQTPKLIACFCLDLDTDTAERISDVCLRHKILFLLDSLGFIYVFDTIDGSIVAEIELPIKPEVESVEPLKSIRVSPNLDLIVVSCGTSCFLPLRLSDSASENTIHSLRTWRNERQSKKSMSNEDDLELSSCDIHGHTLGHAFRMNRSWDATLSSIFNDTRSFTALPEFPQPPGIVTRSISSVAPLSWRAVGGGGWVRVMADKLKDALSLHIWSVSSFSALFCLRSIDGHATLVQWDMETQDITDHALGKALCVDCTDDEACLVITDRGLSLVLFAVSQNEFLTRLMIHGSASTADTLCHLNNWGRCSVPIHTLEAGLENRQLDTVDFFLKSKESILSPLTSEEGGIQSEHYLHNVQDLVPALDLLFSYIHGTDLETQSKHFSEQLLQLTLHFLNGQLLLLCNLLAEPDPSLEQCVGIVTGYITKLRPFMKKFYQQPLPVQPTHAERGHGAWENMSVESIISDAIMTNFIPEAQMFLRAQGHPSSLTWLKQEGLKLVYRCLLESRVTEACQLLQNMGYSVWDELRRICLHTSNLGIRTLLVDLLQREGCFLERELEEIRTLCQVEELYVAMCKSAGERKRAAYSRPAWKICTVSPEVEALQDALISLGGDPGILTLHWAQGWDTETQESILLPWRNSTDMSAFMPRIFWRHLTLWHDWPRIVSWIERTRQYEETENSQSPLWPPLSPEVIDENTLCCGYTRQKILDKLSRMSIFLPSDMNDFERLVERLAVSGKLMTPATPPLDCSYGAHPEIHNRFVVLCAERGLQYMLYTYLDFHRLHPEVCSALANTSLHETYPWFGLLVHIRQVSDSTEDANRMFHASLSNAHMLMPGYQPSVNSMLLEGHTLLALATNMYASGGIDGVLDQSEEPSPCQWNVDLPLLKMALGPYPKLKAALFPQHPANCGSPPDISLYHLLQALSPFHPSRFFTWQSTNPLAAADASTVLPHCSCPELVSKLSTAEQLDVFFHLRSGRPAVAFSTFVVHQLLKSKIPHQLIQKAAEDVYSLALSCFSVPSVIASCVCFLELLGISSHKLRVDVSVANLILKHTTPLQEDPGHKSHTQALAQRLTKLVESETETAKDLLLSLDEVVAADLQQEGSPHPCNGLWLTVVQFCLLHSIPMTSTYLRNYAQKQDWLQLLMHTNSPGQVFHVLNDLNPVLANHIALALQDMGSADCPLKEIGSEANTASVHRVMLKCLSMAEPGQMLLKECVRCRVPLFSVLAACVQETDCVSCLCAWIVTSVDAATYSEVTLTVTDTVDRSWNMEDLTQLWDILLGRKDSRTLHKAFSIFVEDSPLLLLLETYELCLQHKNYLEAKERMLDFHSCMMSLQSLDSSSLHPVPVLWLQTRASQLLHLLLTQSQTPYELQKVLQLLCDSDSQHFCTGVDLHKLSTLTRILEDQSVLISKDLLCDYSPAALQVECQRLLKILIESGHFSLAHQVAELADLPTDNLVIEEVLQEQHLLQEIGQWACPKSRAQYWHKCHNTFSTNQLSPAVASNFFQSQASRSTAPTVIMAEQMESLAEQELLLTLGGHWLSLSECVPLRTLEDLEQQIWKCRIERELLNMTCGSRLLSVLSSFTGLTLEFSFSCLPAFNTPLLLDIASLPPLRDVTQGKNNSTDSRVLRSLIDQLLDDSKVHEASRVCRYFQLSHRDLWLVLSCRALASGEITVDQLHPNIQSILTEGIDAQDNIWTRKKTLQSSSSLESTSSQTPISPVITYLEVLKDACTHGKTFCRQLLCMYELSQDLGCSFSEISSRDPSEVLRTLLSSYRLELSDRAQAVISSHGLPPETVAQIVAEESLKIWRTLDKEGGQFELYNVSEKRSNFLQLAKLCPDPTLVGLNLLDHLENVPLTELHCIIELLISAHDCFSLTCHLEGIRRVLQACRHLTEMHLAPNQEYSLMVRLLSGIGRYNDMVYVFDILHKNQHFEVLLRKQLDTKGGLQTALLEYIKRCHPGDSEKHNMTALCFSLHRDIGHNHEHAAKIQLRLIQSRPWEYWMSDLRELRSSIMKALTLLIDAAESYSKDSCVRQSLRCARLTRLLTLQLHLLNNGHQTKLINLDIESLMEPILALPRFYQAVIVTEAYDVQPDWAEILYTKVIVGSDFQYLEEFKQRQLLSSGVFEQLSNKCQLNPPGATGLNNLKRVISYCEDINTRYKLAHANKFYDITDVLMRDSQTRCCLTDMLLR